MKKEGLVLLSEEEYIKNLGNLIEQCVAHSLLIDDNGKIFFILKDALFIGDEEIDWESQEKTIGMHSFIEIWIKQPNSSSKKIVLGPFCWLNRNMKVRLIPLLNTTINPSDGRLNSKEGEFWIIDSNNRGFQIRTSLAGMAMAFLQSNLLPNSWISHEKYGHKDCLCCRELKDEGGIRK